MQQRVKVYNALVDAVNTLYGEEEADGLELVMGCYLFFVQMAEETKLSKDLTSILYPLGLIIKDIKENDEEGEGDD